MLTKHRVMVGCVAVLIIVNMVTFSIESVSPTTRGRPVPLTIALTGPFQEIAAHSIRFLGDIWRHYFWLVSVAQKNEALHKVLGEARRDAHACREAELANDRLRRLLAFRTESPGRLVPAEIIGKDPAPWVKRVTIDKGVSEGVVEGLPVVVPEGVVGLVTSASAHYASILLIIDPKSSVDALLQKSRVRGIVRGRSADRCVLDYVQRKHDVIEGAVVISSGLDGVFPKGLRVGWVDNVIPKHAGIFQEVVVVPAVDFETIEEVLVVLDPFGGAGYGGR